jgi:cytochrome c556
MGTVKDVVDKIGDLENVANGYLSYDAMVGGLVSKSIKGLKEAKKLLENPTKANITKSLDKIQSMKNDFEPYAAYATDVIEKVDAVIAAYKDL